MNRRGFLQSILAAGVAPAFVGSHILMPVRNLYTPPPLFRGDWGHYGDVVITANGTSFIESVIVEYEFEGSTITSQSNLGLMLNSGDTAVVAKLPAGATVKSIVKLTTE